MSILAGLVDEAKKKKQQLEQRLAPAPVAAPVRPAPFVPFRNPVQAAATVPRIAPPLPPVDTSLMASIKRGGAIYGQGLKRSAVGAGQMVSGAADLVTAGTGSNRVSDRLDAIAKRQDADIGRRATDLNNPFVKPLYKTGQLAGDALQMGGGAAAARQGGRVITKAAPALPKLAAPVVAPVTRAVDKLATGNAPRRVAATALRSLAPANLVSVGAATALDQGSESGKDRDVSAGSVLQSLGLNLAMNTGLPVAGHLAGEAAKQIKPAAVKAQRVLDDAAVKAHDKLDDVAVSAANVKPHRQLPDEAVEAAARVRAVQQGMAGNDTISPEDMAEYNSVTGHLKFTGADDPDKALDLVIRDRRIYNEQNRKAVIDQHKQDAEIQGLNGERTDQTPLPVKLKNGRDAAGRFVGKSGAGMSTAAVDENGVRLGLNGDPLKSPMEGLKDIKDSLTTPLNEGGYAKIPTGKRDPAPDLNQEQKDFINDYAEDLERMGAGNGVDFHPDGRKISNNARPDHLKGKKSVTKQEWFDAAREQIEAGNAPYGMSDAYKELDNFIPENINTTDDLSSPAPTANDPTPIQETLAKKQAKLEKQATIGKDFTKENTKAAAEQELETGDDPDTAVSKFPERLLEEDERLTGTPRTTTLQNATHDVKHNKDVLDATARKISQNEDKALSFAKHSDTTEANATALQLLNKYLEEESFDKADDLLNVVLPRFTRQGQETQILAVWSKLTPAGAVKYATREVNNAAKKTGKGQKLDQLVEDTHKQIRQQAKDIAGTIERELTDGTISQSVTSKPETSPTGQSPEERLAARIKAGETKTDKKPDPITDMVDTLHKVAKEIIPEDKANKKPRDVMALIGQAVKGEKEYSDVYRKAREIVKEKYKDNPEAQAELERYFSENPERTYSQGQLDRGVRAGLKDTDLAKLVRKHYSEVDETGEQLKDKLIKQAGLSNDEATKLSKDIDARYRQLVQDRKDAILKQMFGDRPKPEQKTKLDKLLELNNLGALSRDDLRGPVADRLKLPSLSPKAAKDITDMANKIQAMPEGPDREMAALEMMTYIQKQIPTGAAEGATSVWKGGLLSGQKTFQGGVISNTAFAGMKTASNPLSVIADVGLSAITGERTKTLTAKGAASGAKEGVQKGWQTWKTGIDVRDIQGGKYEVKRELNFKNPVIQTVFGKTSNQVFRTLSAADQPFYYAAAKNTLYDVALAKAKTQGLTGKAKDDFVRNAVANPDVKMAETAKRAAEKAVLGYDTIGSKAIQGIHSKIDELDNSPAGKATLHTIVNVLAPFVKVPSAFISRTIDFTPAGPIKEAVRQMSNRTFDQRALSEAIGEGITGTGVIVLGIALNQNELLSGSFPKTDPKEQARWKAEGITPNSIKLGNKWYSLNYLGPVGLLFNAAKQFDDGDGDGFVNQVAQAAGGLGQGLLGQSFLQGFSGFSDAIQDPERNMQKFVNSQASSVVPAWLNDVANVTDKYQRQADGPVEAMKNRIPGLRQDNKIKQDVYGNKLEQASGQFNTLNAGKPSDSLTDKSPAAKEVNRLHQANPDNQDLQVTPTQVSKDIDVEGTKLPLNPDQRYELQEKTGQFTQKVWDELIATKEYQALSDPDKAKALTNLRQAASELATRDFVEANNLASYDKRLSRDARMLKKGSAVSRFATAAGDPDAELSFQDKYDDAQAEWDDESNGWSDVKRSNKQRTLNTLKLQKDYPTDIVSLYGMNKQQVYDVVSNNPDGNAMVKQMLDYGDKLKAAGLTTSNKFRDKYGRESVRPKETDSARSSSVSPKSFKTPFDTALRHRSKGASLARSAKLARRRA